LSARFRGLWRHPDFLKLWGGQTVSVFGSQISQLAVPTVAILVLKATPFQVGLLGALQFLAFPTLGLLAGVWVDRLYRRPVLILCDVARALALATIPIAYVMGGLTMEVLYAVALVAGVATVFFDVAYQSYLPALIDRQDLVEGNTKLEISRSSAQIAGPPLTGALIQILQPAWAVLLDAISFVISAVSIGAIGKPEPVPQPGTMAGKRGFWAEMGEGLRVVLGSPILRMISASTATSNLGSNIGGAVVLIFVYRQLHFSPALAGVVFGLASVGWLLGTMLAARTARRLKLGPTLVVAMAGGGLVGFAVPLAGLLPLILAPGLLVAAWFVQAAMIPIYNINQLSLRQAIVTDRVQGRMNATVRTIVWGTIPVGSFLGGVLGSAIGVWQTLVVGAAVSSLAVFWLLAKPVRSLREQPAPYRTAEA
jgi:MFS family permease